jgi:ABC-type uncharacterized transport system permease subunit
MIPINKQPGPRELRAFARLWFPLFVAAIGGAIWWRADAPVTAVSVWAVGGAIAAAVLASTEVARIVFVGLITLTYPIGLVISTVVLAFMFYLVFTPFGYVMRLIGRDALRLRARDASSHWIPYAQDDGPERAFRQY